MKRLLMASVSALAPHVTVPSDFAHDPIGDYWRGIMFGWDDRQTLEFDGLSPRLVGREGNEKPNIIVWSDYGARRHW